MLYFCNDMNPIFNHPISIDNMKHRPFYAIAWLALLSQSTNLSAQNDHASSNLTTSVHTATSVPFNVEDAGVKRPVIWGLDTAWPSADNMRRGVAFIGKEHLGTARGSFQPSDLVVNGELSAAQKKALDNRLNIIQLSGVTEIALNCDHEALNAANYVGKPEEWAKLIEATTRYCQAKGFTVLSVAPFNEPDYTAWGQGSMQDFYNVAKLLKANPLFENIRICGGNTLNCDQALPWYNGLKEYLDEGNTHQLAGSFDNYANFFQTVRSEGKHATADELHNVMEAMVGVEYGMQTGIWWGFDALARGEFCKATSGDRLAYAENRSCWSAAAVYRNNEENKVQAFLGTSERQANTSTYQFISKDREVFFDGYGPTRDFTVEMPGGTGYQVGQTNAERVVNISWGEDVPSYINGNYVLVNANSGKVLSYPHASATAGSNVVQKSPVANATYQQWSVTPVSSRIGGDFSYYTIQSLASNKYVLDVLNYSLDSGANIIAYHSNNGAQQQWYLKYAGDGYFYIVSRQSNLCLRTSGKYENVKVTQAEITDEADRKWRFIPVGAAIESTAPAIPTALAATPQPASILLNWEANTERDLAGYTLFRAEDPLAADKDTLFNTIGRDITATTFVDNTVKQGVKYLYKIKAQDKSGNLSEASALIGAKTEEYKGKILQLQFDSNLTDQTVNRFDAAFYGTPIYSGSKKSGEKSLMLNGTDQYIRLPYQVANMREMTICTWFRWSAEASWQRIFDFGNGTDQYLFLTPSNGNEMRFVMKNGGEEQILSTKKLGTSTWKHIAVTISDEAIILYVNGEELARSTEISIRPSDIQPVMNYIGRSQYPADPLIKGFIDDFRIYNYALSPEEIMEVTEDLSDVSITTGEESPIVATEYYTPNGVRLNAPVKGINIVRYIHADGSIETDKILKP